jgi:hypothetical protein
MNPAENAHLQELPLTKPCQAFAEAFLLFGRHNGLRDSAQ